MSDELGSAGTGAAGSAAGSAVAAPTGSPAGEGSFSTSVPTTPGGSAAPADRPFLDSIPTEYRDKGWAQEFAKNEKPWDALVKSHANALELVGKRGVEVPGEGATPETISAYNKAIGVPEAPTGYAYTPPDISALPEPVRNALVDRAKDTTFIDNMRAIAHKAGIPADKFAALAAGFDKETIAQVSAQIEGRETAAKAYNESETKIFKELYGDKGEQVKATAKEILAKVVPKSIQDSKNANLALVAAAMFINEKVFKNDTIGGANQGAPQMSKEQVRAEILKQRSDPAFKDPFNPGHKAISARVDDLYNQLHSRPPGE